MNLTINSENYNSAIELFKNGNYQEAVAFFDRFIQDNPFIFYGQAYLWRGVAKYQINEFQAAIDDLTQANSAFTTDESPNEIHKIYNFRGLAYAKLGQNQKASEDLYAAISITANLLEANQILYKISIVQKDFMKSSIALKNIKKIEGNLSKIIEVGRNALYNEQNFALAKAIFTDILKEESENDICYYFRAVANYNLDLEEEAIKDIEKNLELHPVNYGSHTLLGLIYQDRNQWELANREFLKAYELGDTNALELIKNNSR